MKRLPIPILLVIFTFYSCNYPGPSGSMEKWKEEVIETEKAFARMAKDSSISEAFIHYAADEAVLMRSNALIKGKASIIEHFNPEQKKPFELSLAWAPDFVEVSASGDLAYTYGKYLYTKTDSAGTTKQEGIFHTVWKRQKDGSWKYVWD